MPDPNSLLLQSIFANQNVGGDPVLNAFKSTVGQNDYWKMAGGALLSSPLNTTMMDPLTGFGANFAKSFLGTGLGIYGNQREAAQLDAVSKILPNMYRGEEIAAPEGVDPEAFAGLKLNVARENQLRGIKRQETMQDLLAQLGLKRADKELDAEYAGRIEKAKEQGKYEAMDPDNPDLPANKKEQKTLDNIDGVRKQFNSLPPVKEFTTVQQAAEAISGALKDTGKISDQELTRYAILMIEPGMAVREGEAAAVKSSQSIPDEWRGNIAGALEGKTTLSDDARAGIQRLATRAYNAKKNSYDKAFGYYQDLAVTDYGMPKEESISFLGQAPSAESIFGAPIEPPPLDEAAEMAAFAARAKANGLSKEQARAAWEGK